MDGKLVYVPVIAYVPIRVTERSTPGQMLDAAEVIARHNMEADENAITLVSSDKQPWVLANADGSSPTRYERVFVPGKGFGWYEYNRQPKGYGY